MHPTSRSDPADEGIQWSGSMRPRGFAGFAGLIFDDVMQYAAVDARTDYGVRMSLVSRFAGALKPEYLFQPRVLIRRLRTDAQLLRGPRNYLIPGGGTIEARAEEEHGRMLSTLGVIDLPVTEALWRLTAANEVCADVGANIGYMTGIFAGRMREGTIHSFEALPSVFEELKRNVESLRATFPSVRIEAYPAAVSSSAGTLRMAVPDGFDGNRGLAKVTDNGPVAVPAITLDEQFGPARIDVMKLDVEGHEAAVLDGAKRMLASHRIRDCVFEEHRPFPTDVTTRFEECGYKVFRLGRRLIGPVLLDPRSPGASTHWLPDSFLATYDERRARARFARLGWASLRPARST